MNDAWKKHKVRKDKMPADLYPTPHEATEALLSVEDFDGPIWEPASGLGHITKVLRQRGYRVFSSDLHAEKYAFGESLDFLTSDAAACWRLRGLVNVVTNPPYTLLRPFLRMALRACSETAGKVAFFLPFEFMRVRGNLRICEEWFFPKVHLLVPCLDIEMGGERGKQQSSFNHAWFIWNFDSVVRPDYFVVKPLYWKEI